MRPDSNYANVMSTLCFFLLLGGGAAYAAGHLGKNAVGTKQLKKNAVTTAKSRRKRSPLPRSRKAPDRNADQRIDLRDAADWTPRKAQKAQTANGLSAANPGTWWSARESRLPESMGKNLSKP